MQAYELKSPQALVDFFAETRDVYQQLENPSGDIDWQIIKPGSRTALKEHHSLSSPKNLFFAEHENIFTFDGECFRETLPTPEPFAVFGVQSCDLNAIAYQDQFFSEDPYYQARRKQALLVGLDCVTPCNGGFCVNVNAGPGVKDSTADLILHKLHDDCWLMLVTSDQGQEAVREYPLVKASEDILDEREKRLYECETEFKKGDHIEKGVRALNQQSVPESLWQSLGVQCLGCSGCTTLCPTCSCYATRDLNLDDGNVRQQRFWDSCLYESFQREASLYNPSSDPGERVRRFWTHKFGDAFVEEFGSYGCVGCGRCEQTCPGVVGVHSVMKRLAEYG